MTKFEGGFPSYPSNDDDSIIQADLTSATAIDGGSLQGGSQTFTADGMDVGSRFGVAWTGKTDQHRLNAEGTIRFDIDRGWIDLNETTLNTFAYMLSYHGGTTSGWPLLKEQASNGVYSRPTSTHSTSDEYYLKKTGKAERIPIHVTWDYGEYMFAVDDLPIGIHKEDVGVKVDKYTILTLGGDRTNAGSGPSGYSISNFEAIARKLNFPINPDYGQMVFFGDSMTIRGNFPVDMQAPGGRRKRVWFAPGYGYLSEGSSSPAAAGLMYDVGLQPSYFRTMFKNGLFPGKCWNEAASGENITQCDARLDAFFDTNHHQADIATLFIGTNELTSGSEISVAGLATIETNYKALITKLNTNGVKKCVICTVPTLLTLTGFGAHNNTNVDNFNAIVATIPAWVTAQGYDINVAVADVFNALDGHVDTYFTAGDIHPIEAGSQIMGNLMAETMLTIAK